MWRCSCYPCHRSFLPILVSSFQNSTTDRKLVSGDVQSANSYYEDPYNNTGRFDFVMANPPFNVDGVDKARLLNSTQHFPFGIPRVDNANYLWIQLFYSALKQTGRAGFVMPNSASDARSSEQDIRRGLLSTTTVVMKAHESLDENVATARVGGLGFDGPRVASRLAKRRPGQPHLGRTRG